MYAIHLVEKYDLYSDLDLADILFKLAEMQKTDPITKLLSK